MPALFPLVKTAAIYAGVANQPLSSNDQASSTRANSLTLQALANYVADADLGTLENLSTAANWTTSNELHDRWTDELLELLFPAAPTGTPNVPTAAPSTVLTSSPTASGGACDEDRSLMHATVALMAAGLALAGISAGVAVKERQQNPFDAPNAAVNL
ncbi:hypothetical protein [Caenimonas sp. SL110]|uniref:hypothetical protein n=1 Tax=Caenimonas sp. SL110 TaxID=1450524 RepID=UPI0006545007|nr:hypothetical protein [Caenimonas sp. SL110]